MKPRSDKFGLSQRQPAHSDSKNPDLAALAYLYSRVPFLIGRMEQLFTMIFAAETSGKQITFNQLLFLQVLDRAGPMPQADLARLTGFDKSTTSLVLQNLHKARLIVRKDDGEDRRRKLASLTPSGRALLKRTVPDLERTQARLVEPLHGKLGRFIQLLRRVASHRSNGSAWPPAGDPDVVAQVKDLEPILTSPAALLRRALQAMDAITHDELAPIRLTIRQFAAMMIILSHPGIGEASLARYGGFESSNAAFVVRLLLANGKIKQMASRSSARKQYGITKAGWAAMQKAGPCLARGEHAMLSGLTPAEIRELRQLLAAVLMHANAQPGSTMPVFEEIVRSPLWPVEAGTMDFLTYVHLPHDASDLEGHGRTHQSSQRNDILQRLDETQLINYVALDLTQKLAHILKPFNLEPSQYWALMLIARNDDLSAADLARTLSLPIKKIPHLLKTLESRRLISRASDPSDRLALPRAGRDLLQKAEAEVGKFEADWFKSLSMNQRETLRSLLLSLTRMSE